MKTKTRRMRNWSTGALLLWLAFAPLAQAFYNPSTGKWLSRDPLGEQGGLNVCGFIRNDPLNRIDHLGLKPRFSAGGCVLRVHFGFRVHFHDTSPPVDASKLGEAQRTAFEDYYRWSESEKAQWKKTAAETIKNYFSGWHFRCHCSSKRDCPSGYRIEASVDMELGDSQINVYAGYLPEGKCKNGDDAACYENDTDSFQLPSNSIEWDSTTGDDGAEYNNNALLHEVGHSLGLGHPCPPGPEEYSCDPSNIMGNVGWKLSEADFNKAFCSRINKLIGGNWSVR